MPIFGQQHQQQHQAMAPPTQQSSAAAPIPQIPSNPLQNVPLPESSDDYAKALQEAYRRGAEAAARLQHQQQQQQHMSTAASCPDLQQFQGQPNDPTVAQALVPNPLSSVAATAAPPPHHQHHHHHQQQQQLAPPPQRHQQQQQQQQAPSAVPSGVASRSLSMPDMQSYAARAQAEEGKRKKRLARNRASARLRRLRKKNLVDSYEGEVGVLESALEKLRSHTWGSNHEALLGALSMERGQQELSNEERIKLIKDIINQQLEQLAFLREAQMEQQLLLNIVENPEDEISMELQGVLNLDDTQKENIRKACEGLDKEVEAMETFISCLEAMQKREWFWNEGVTQITDQFTSILHSNQLSKFLLWTDANAEALDSLEFCKAPAATAPTQGAPVFVFGMDDHAASQSMGGGDD